MAYEVTKERLEKGAILAGGNGKGVVQLDYIANGTRGANVEMVDANYVLTYIAKGCTYAVQCRDDGTNKCQIALLSALYVGDYERVGGVGVYKFTTTSSGARSSGKTTTVKEKLVSAIEKEMKEEYNE